MQTIVGLLLGSYQVLPKSKSSIKPQPLNLKPYMFEPQTINGGIPAGEVSSDVGGYGECEGSGSRRFRMVRV